MPYNCLSISDTLFLFKNSLFTLQMCRPLTGRRFLIVTRWGYNNSNTFVGCGKFPMTSQELLKCSVTKTTPRRCVAQQIVCCNFGTHGCGGKLKWHFVSHFFVGWSYSPFLSEESYKVGQGRHDLRESQNRRSIEIYSLGFVVLRLNYFERVRKVDRILPMEFSTYQ